MNNVVVLLVVVVASSASDPREWAQYKVKFNKRYDSLQEEQYRREIFSDSLKRIEEHNARFEQGLTSFTIGINQFSDMTDAESAQYTNCYIPRTNNGSLNTGEVPFIWSGELVGDEVDWRNKGAVTNVKNQGHCGSCWAFSTTGSLEGQHFLKTGSLVELSEQNLVDCSKENNGCTNGNVRRAFDYILRNQGIDTESAYPYEYNQRECRYNSNSVGATITGYTTITSGSEDELKQAVGTKGPVSVVINLANTFREYNGGVHYNSQCSATNELHAVLVVGYGIDPKEGDYWIVKNSWNSTWGVNGYILMARNRDNNCGIATDAVYPTV